MFYIIFWVYCLFFDKVYTKINYSYNRKQMNLKNIVLNTLLINWIIGIIATAIYFVLYFSSEEFDAKIVAVSIIFGVYGTIVYIL